MGLESYFYRHTKLKESDRISGNEWSNLFNDNDLQDIITKLNTTSKERGVSLCETLKDILKGYLNNNVEDGHYNDILYLRKFYFLNNYFNYTDEWYGKDKIITKEQCIELRDRAKECIDEIDKVCCEKNITIHDYDYTVSKYSVMYNSNSDNYGYESFIDDIIYKRFPVNYKCSNIDLYSKVLHLYHGMNSIISETNWENKDIIYNADW